MISTVILSTSLITVNSKYEELNAKINSLETTIEQKENSNGILRERIDTLEQQLNIANEKIRIYEGRPSDDEVKEKLENGEYNFDFAMDKAKENDFENWQKEKNSDKPDLNVNWN